MKPALFILLLTLFTQSVYGQKKFSVGLEIGIGISEETKSGFDSFREEGFQLGRNFFLNGGYSLTKNLDLTLGIGYLATQEYELSLFGFVENADFIEIFRDHQYIVIPAGFRYHFGSFYIQPEIGVGISNVHIEHQYQYIFNDNGVTTLGTGIDTPDFFYSQTTIPTFLSLGNEIQLKSLKILLGVKGYYSLTPIQPPPVTSGHYFGVGIMTGLRF